MDTNLNIRPSVPVWRRCLYLVLLAVAIGLLGLFDRLLLFLVPCGIVAAVVILIGIIRLSKNPSASKWVRKYKWWLILAYVIGHTVLLLWKWLAT